MRILIWHVHGSWMTGFVQGPDEYLIPVLPDRGPDGRGRARTWDWPANARELTPAELAEADFDVVVLQRPEELALVQRWTGRRPGIDVPAVYVEHNAPEPHPVLSRHHLADREDIPVVHVTDFNALMWDSGRAPTTVVDHGVVDPGHLYIGSRARVAVVVNEPVRRGRMAGTDLVLGMAARVPLEVYGMGTAELARLEPSLDGFIHDLSQAELHRSIAHDRAYFHPYRWTSLGLSLIEAMMVGLPVLVVASTQAPVAVPAAAGVVSPDPQVLQVTARRWLADRDEAAERGRAARAHALATFGVERFLTDWQAVLKEVVR
ncbi:glycosyltransferase [Nakamurella leprariae]|uniref:Glycosyltransferase n=1 Tax=Nakamurella leprariae TaxID=2803911 RepID=A0A938YGW6_9ACTN|nr:glycosyltransferase [Nakamurella leprariae]MBM9469378.1 glycosyltransferase [Nakamurella leprariae]